MISANLKISNV